MWYGNQLINNFWQLKVGSLEKKIVKRIIPIAQISLMHSFMGEIPHQNFLFAVSFLSVVGHFVVFSWVT